MIRSPAAAPGPGRSALQRWGRGAPILLLFLAAAFLFRAVLLGRGLFYYRDILQNFRPIQAAIRAELAAGRLPLWNPYLGLGQPLLANPNHLALHPATWLLAVFPLDTAVTLSIVLGTALALAGMYLLLRELGTSPAAAFLGASAYGFSGLFLSFGNLPNLIASASWLPLCLFWVLRFWRRPTAWRALAAVLGVALLWICAEVATLAAFFLVAVALMIDTPERTVRSEARPTVARKGLQLAGIVTAGGLLAAVQWLPFLDLLARSRRGGGFPLDVAARWSLHPVRLWELLLPQLFGDPTSLDPRRNWGLGFFETGFPFLLSIYVGPLVLLLAAAVFCRRPRRRHAALLAVIGISVLFAFGRHTPLFPILHQWVPGLASTRYPIRFLLGAQIGLAMLAAAGLDRVFGASAAGPEDRRSRNAMALGLLAVFAAGLAATSSGVVSRAAAGLIRVGNAPGTSASVQPFVAAGLKSGLSRVVVLCGLCYVILYLLRRRGIRPAPLAWAFAALVGADLVQAGAGVMPVEVGDIYRGGTDRQPTVVSFLRSQDGLFRVQREERPPGVRIRMPDASVVWGYDWDRATLSRATPVEFGLRMGFGKATDYLDLDRPAEFIRQAREIGADAEVRLLCRSGVRFLMSYRDRPAADQARQVASLGARSDPPARIFELPCAVPRVYGVGAARGVTGPGEALAGLVSESFDPRTTVLIESLQPDDAAAAAAPGSIPVRLAVDEPGHLEAEVSADRPAWVVFLENDYPGWRARVDGEPQPVRTANGLFQAVAVPPGEHRVRLEYRTGARWRGAVFAVLGLLMAIRVLPRRKRRRPAAVRPRLPLPSAETT